MASGTGALESTQQSVLSALQGGGLGGGAVTVADGADVAQGTTTDAAWTSGAGTEIALLKKLVAQLATTLGVSGTVTANAGTNLNTSSLALETGGNLAAIKTDADAISTNTSNINTHAASIDTATAASKADLDTIATNTTGLATQTTLAAAKTDLDTIVTQTATPNVSDRWARQVGQVDLARVLGAALSQSNPVITESNIQNWMRNGQAFVANGRGVTATNANLLNCALSIFNPANSGKNILLYSIKALVSTTASTLSQWNLTTSDPGNANNITTAITPIRLPGATSPSTIASVYQTTSGNTTTVAAPGTKVEEFLLTAQVSTELLTNSASILLTPGNGIAIMMLVGTAGGYYQSFAKWIEY